MGDKTPLHYAMLRLPGVRTFELHASGYGNDRLCQLAVETGLDPDAMLWTARGFLDGVPHQRA